jgi:23S rRNA pseudouridine2605 synthase
VTERLQKFLAGAGVASRRKAEELVAAGRVKVNGVVVREMGAKVDPANDHVEVDGRPVEGGSRARYVLLYKPPGCVTTLSDPEGRPTVAQYLGGISERVFPVGRLDWDAEGALLFTTDGDLANRLAHPRYGHRRTYLVKVKGDPLSTSLGRMVAGVRLDDGPAKALEASIHERVDKNTWIRVVVGEGRRHLVKRLCESVGLEVLRLFRPEFGGVSVAGLRPGHHRDLDRAEVDTLRRAAGLPGGPASPAPPMRLPKAARRHGHGPPAPRRPSEGRPARPGDPRSGASRSGGEKEGSSREGPGGHGTGTREGRGKQEREGRRDGRGRGR